MFQAPYHTTVESQNYRPMNIIIDEDSAGGTGALWLGDYTAATDRTTLKLKGIRSVLTVASGLNIQYPASLGINHKTFNILDIESAIINKIFGETNVLIAEGLKKGGVLVHCAAGVSRSASTVIAYIMKTRGWTFQETFNFVKKKRYVVCPNFGFQRQLKQYEKSIEQKVPQPNQMNQSAYNQNDQFKRQEIKDNTLLSQQKNVPYRPMVQFEEDQPQSRLTESINEKFSRSQISRARSVQKPNQNELNLAVTATSAFRTKPQLEPRVTTPLYEMRVKTPQQYETRAKTPLLTSLPPFKNEKINAHKYFANMNLLSTYASSYGSPIQPQIVTYNARNNMTVGKSAGKKIIYQQKYGQRQF